MATVKVKLRSSTIEGKAGTIYYQIIHNRIVRQLKTEYKVYTDEWSDACGVLKSGHENGVRADILSSIQERINWDLIRLNAIIERFDKKSTQYTADDTICAFTTQAQGQSFFNFMQGVIAHWNSLINTAQSRITLRR